MNCKCNKCLLRSFWIVFRHFAFKIYWQYSFSFMSWRRAFLFIIKFQDESSTHCSNQLCQRCLKRNMRYQKSNIIHSWMNQMKYRRNIRNIRETNLNRKVVIKINKYLDETLKYLQFATCFTTNESWCKYWHSTSSILSWKYSNLIRSFPSLYDELKRFVNIQFTFYNICRMPLMMYTRVLLTIIHWWGKLEINF